MELVQANALAISLMEKHGLSQTGWKFQFDKSTRRFGYCNYRKRVVSVSYKLTELNEEKDVRNTILHEIAHALVDFNSGHGPVWKAKHREIGGDGERLYKNHVNRPEPRYTATCQNCKRVYRKQRIRRLAQHGLYGYACTTCCNNFNNGRYDAQFKLFFSITVSVRP